MESSSSKADGTANSLRSLNCLCHPNTFQDQTEDMDTREADFNCHVVPKAPDSQYLQGLLWRVISREVHLTSK
jgi:hypothetical protein